MKSGKWLMSALLTIGVTAPVWGQNTPDHQNKLLSKRAAEADAFRKLAECIKGLLISSDTYVRDFVAESDVIRAEMDTFIKGIRLGKPMWYADLSCEVPAEVTVAKVITTLKEIHQRHYKGNRIKATDIVEITKRIDKKVIKVVGMGAPRPDLPPGLPAGVAEGVPTLPNPPIPALWVQLGPQARLLAIRAARVDAMRRLLERIRGLRIDSSTLVRDFVVETDVVQTVARGTLIGATETRVYLHDDEPIAEVTMEIPLETVITTIKALHQRSIQGSTVKATDITNVTRSIKTKTFEATGMGIPPAQHIVKIEEVTKVSYPGWSKMPIRMTGNAVPPPEKAGTPQGKLLAARGAELAAKQKLGEHIDGLLIESNTTVRDFVTEHDEIATHMDAILVGSSVEKTSFDGETAEVTVSIPGMQVWEIIHQRTIYLAKTR